MQLGSGELLWEDSSNRKVTAPDDAPLGTMLVADCAFNYAGVIAVLSGSTILHSMLQLHTLAQHSSAASSMQLQKQFAVHKLRSAG